MDQIQQYNPLAAVFSKEHDLRGLNPLNGVFDAIAVKPTPIVRARRTGESMDVRKILRYARDRNAWVVAYDNGAYTLNVDAFRVNIDVCTVEEFAEVLSHKEDPSLMTSIGPVPKSFMRATYLRPTWVDFINHFNIPEHRQRVTKEQGAMFAKKKCRALYLEREVPFHEQVVACAGTRMWQELSIGEQAQHYGSVEAVWLHLVTAVGEVVSSYAAADLQSIARILTDIADGETEETHRWKHQHDNSEAVTRVFKEYASGNLVSFVSQVFRVKGWVHSHDFVATVAENLHINNTRDGALQFAAVIKAATVVLSECVAALSKYRKSDYSGWSDNAHVITGIEEHHYPRSLRRGGLLSVEVSRRAAGGIMDQTRAGWTFTSAAVSLGNRNASAEEDRVVACFGALCAENKMHCGPATVTELLYRQENLDVACLRASVALGVAAVTVKKIGFGKIGERASLHHVTPEGVDLIAKAVTGGLVELTDCEQVWVSGLSLGRCAVATKRPLFGDRGNLTRFFTKKDDQGEVLGYRVKDNSLVQLRLRLDDGSFVSVVPQGGIYRQRFVQWHTSLAPAEESDFDWL